ncbi:protein downstream neighbor of son homolog [Pollicipes pollicipes]|uniref:protein downstream neighbor of son homolog n=1 Tax=Pollicipes pollicipes TaxID=41117 RepID=UPI001884BECA|nr:protein downstream neighbor of son homolog [Pollicipes pollicipes]
MQFQVEEAPKGERNLPTDWGLKTKIRFLSKTPFPWTSRLKTLEEASAVTSCVRCLPADQSTLDTSPNAQLQRHALYWQHPWLPWLTLFPRLHSRVAGARSLFIDAPMQDLLRTEWGESLRSLFQLLRSRQCPFFYVCAASFCCLFRAAGVGGVTDTHAIVTPTTRGLRDLLKRDDVQFTLPLRPAAAPAQSAAQEDGSEDEDEDPEHWLESKGIAADAMPGMHSTRRKLAATVRLLNFLLNSRACVTASGPLVRHGTVQQARETFHSFELIMDDFGYPLADFLMPLEFGDPSDWEPQGDMMMDPTDWEWPSDPAWITYPDMNSFLPEHLTSMGFIEYS